MSPSMNAFIQWMGSVVDMWSTQSFKTWVMSDQDAIAHDWNAVGNDIRWAINRQ